MRRHGSLGLLRRSHVRRRHDDGRTQVQKFVTKSQVNDIILFNKLTHRRPEIQTLQFANDDVDWELEYFCEVLGKWLKRFGAWIMWLFHFFKKCIQKMITRTRKKANGYDESSSDTDEFEDHPKRVRNRMPSIVKLPVTMDKDARSKVWKFKNCQPVTDRHFLRRKWLLNPETKEWAEKSLDTFQRHVKRGFRSLCSGIGKDTKIYVVSSSSSNNPASSFSQIKTTVFLADSSILKSQSQLFRAWFSLTESKKEIETSAVTPEEMEAILVYIYTLTWPTSMIVAGEGKYKKRKLSKRFFEILKIYGISLKLLREVPSHDDNYSVDLFSDSSHRSFRQYNLPPLCGSGDSIPFFNVLQDVDHTKVRIESESKHSKLSNSSSSFSRRPTAQIKDNRNSSKSFLRERLRIPHASGRVHPEIILLPDERLRLFNKVQTTDFLRAACKRHKDISVEELENV